MRLKHPTLLQLKGPKKMDGYSTWRKANKLPPLASSRRVSKAVFLSSQAWRGLSGLALANGCVRGNKPSVSQFLEKLGLGEFRLQALENS